MNILAKLAKFLFFIIIIATLGGIVYYNRANYKTAYQNIRKDIGFDKPCSSPIVYSIGRFDSQFGENKSEFLSDIDQAISIWNVAANKELFHYVDGDNQKNPDDLVVNLIYDNRQQATQEMNSIDSTINNGQESYNSIKARFNSLQSAYDAQKSAFNQKTATYQNEKIAYDKDVAYWNSRGGAPKQEFSSLQSRQTAINAEANALNAESTTLNTMVNQLNATVGELNALGKGINQNISTYNSVSTSNGPEFQEGEFVSDKNGERINIYQYKDQAKLIRVLAHEFGHALGLDHVADPKAIMYAYNLDSSLKLTSDDIAALKTVCGIQ